VNSLCRAETNSHQSFDATIDQGSGNDYKGTSTTLPISCNAHSWRYPFIVFLDGVVDEGNLGAILRTSFFLGVDAVVISKRGTATLSPVTLKASAGAAEAIPILSVRDPSAFLQNCTQNGWQIYAADMPRNSSLPPQSQTNVCVYRAKGDSTSSSYEEILPPFNPLYRARSGQIGETQFDEYIETEKTLNSKPLDLAGVEPRKTNELSSMENTNWSLKAGPSILVFGSEGYGLNKKLREHVDYYVGIRPQSETKKIGLDSLNVSACAAILIQEFLQHPSSQVATATNHRKLDNQASSAALTERTVMVSNKSLKLW
jgi:21S rRNA (GM2251-2'-O)-methyltransferase